MRLEQGEPLPYVLGEWEFYGLKLTVTSAVLIPRPETELLVETAVAWLQENPTRRYAADIGVGSGAICVSLAVKIPNLQLVATDRSSAAIAVGAENARRYAVLDRIEFTQADIFPHPSPHGKNTGFDLICANLPYIPSAVLAGLPVAKKEPYLALDGGLDGLEVIRRFLALAPAWIRSAGIILIEIEAGQGSQGMFLAKSHFPSANVEVLHDLAGKDRMIKIQT